MKTVVVAVAFVVAALLCVPLVLVGGDAGPPPPPGGSGLCPVVGGQLAVVLATIRTLESGGDYTAKAAGSSASGAYQFIDTTWAGYGGYAEAWLAPPAVQDAKASINVSAVLAGQHGDVTAVPVVWYIGHLPAEGSPEWDEVPYPSAGNVLTPRQYQAKWMAVYSGLARGASPPSSVTSEGTHGGGPGCSASTTTTTTTTEALDFPMGL
jgi:hypothetical protein